MHLFYQCMFLDFFRILKPKRKWLRDECRQNQIKKFLNSLYKRFQNSPLLRNKSVNFQNLQMIFANDFNYIGKKTWKKFIRNPHKASQLSIAESIFMAPQVIFNHTEALENFLAGAQNYPLLFSLFCLLLSPALRPYLNFLHNLNSSQFSAMNLMNPIETTYQSVEHFISNQLEGKQFF